MEKLVVDTNVFIHAIRNADARAELAAWQRRLAPQIYQHAVVIAEILIGARDQATWKRWYERWVAPAERVSRVFVPSHGAWLRASEIVAQLVEAGEIRPGSAKPSFFNDCLLAATSREYGHRIVTHNLADFRLISLVEPAVQVVAPFP